MIDKRYYKKDAYGREIFDHRAYADDEQMRILSDMRQARENSQGHCLILRRVFSFFGKKKSSTTHMR